MNDDVAQALGFVNAAEFHRIVAAVDLSKPSLMAAFKRWQDDDGTKNGLVQLSAAAG
jgi:hypothetical protein